MSNARKFLDVLKERHPDAISAQPVEGPNGRFISVTLKSGDKLTFPIGKKSHRGASAPLYLSVGTLPNPLFCLTQNFGTEGNSIH